MCVVRSYGEGEKRGGGEDLVECAVRESVNCVCVRAHFKCEDKVGPPYAVPPVLRFETHWTLLCVTGKEGREARDSTTGPQITTQYARTQSTRDRQEHMYVCSVMVYTSNYACNDAPIRILNEDDQAGDGQDQGIANQHLGQRLGGPQIPAKRARFKTLLPLLYVYTESLLKNIHSTPMNLGNLNRQYRQRGR